jgi:hypothetical protein
VLEFLTRSSKRDAAWRKIKAGGKIVVLAQLNSNPTQLSSRAKRARASVKTNIKSNVKSSRASTVY